MSALVFPLYAAKAWARGLSVVPIEPGTKRPAKELKGWQGFLGSLPSDETKAAWAKRYFANGWGLLLGSEVTPGYQLMALDIDDEQLVAPTLALLDIRQDSQAFVGKRGAKGLNVFVRNSKAANVKSTTITGTPGVGNIDVLGSGKMTVMPPSLHPETGSAYQIVGRSLLDINFADLPEITPLHLALLKSAYGSPQVVALLRGTQTHTAGLELVARLVSEGASDGQVTALVQSLLPADYEGDTLTELPGWLSSAREKGFDRRTKRSDSVAQAIMQLAIDGCLELFNDGDSTAYATIANGEGAISYRVKSEAFRTWVRYRGHKALGRPLGTVPLKEAITGVEAIALFDGPSYKIYNRIAGDDSCVEIDLGTADGRTVFIDKDGWRLTNAPRYKFARGAGFDSLPDPTLGGDLQQIRELLGLSQQNFLLIIAYVVNALKPRGPFFSLLVEGEQGSGKSFVCEVIKKIVDPNKAPRLRLPDNEKDLMIQAKEYRLLNFDNTSGMKADMSDALCALATGGGIAVRKLWTDDDLNVMSYARPFVLNGISGYVTRPDLMERAVPIRLPAMSEQARKTEAEMVASFEALLPGLLGTLYGAISVALRDYDRTDPPRQLRMADAARWIRAAESALGLEGKLVEAISGAQDEFVLERINDEPLLVDLRAVARQKPFEGYVSVLLGELNPLIRGLPTTPSRLSHQLKRLRPAMAKAGVVVEFLGRDRRGQRVRVTVDRSLCEPDFEQQQPLF